MARIVLENVSKSFTGPKGEAVHAVSNVSLAVEDKEFVVLVGPSGCGKSTTLRMIAGLEEISSGTIAIDGRIVNEVEPKDRDVAMVFQNYALYPHMTVYENMAFGLKLRKYPKAEIEKRVRQAAEILGITTLLDRLPKALSGGQRQRVAVGRAIVRQPKAFLFDEPLSNLDAQMRVQMRMELAKLHRRLAATMVYVTHDQVEAMTMGNRIAVMKDGVIQQVADPIHLYQHPANLFVAGFIGAPPMNFFRGTLGGEPGGLCFIEAAPPRAGQTSGFQVRLSPEHSAKLSGRSGLPVILGLRPEDIGLSTGGVGTAVDSTVDAVVELVEPLGAETLFHLTTGAHAMVARLGAAERNAPGQKVRAAFALAGFHFFDSTTEQAIA
jgi:multiple sugar transport system ATP-binding protein